MKIKDRITEINDSFGNKKQPHRKTISYTSPPPPTEDQLFMSSDKEGWLLKAGKRRYFVLLNYTLKWFADPQEEAKGKIDDICCYKIFIFGDSGKSIDFKLVPVLPNKKTFMITASSSEEMKGWVRSLQKAKKRRQKELQDARLKGTLSPGKSGFLTKEGHIIKNKKHRWFLLRPGEDQMFYFPKQMDEKEMNALPMEQLGLIAKGYINLNGAVITDLEEDNHNNNNNINRTNNQSTSTTTTTYSTTSSNSNIPPLNSSETSHSHEESCCYFVLKTLLKNGNNKNFYMIAPSQEEKKAWIEIILYRNVTKEKKQVNYVDDEETMKHFVGKRDSAIKGIKNNISPNPEEERFSFSYFLIPSKDKDKEKEKEKEKERENNNYIRTNSNSNNNNINTNPSTLEDDGSILLYTPSISTVESSDEDTILELLKEQTYNNSNNNTSNNSIAPTPAAPSPIRTRPVSSTHRIVKSSSNLGDDSISNNSSTTTNHSFINIQPNTTTTTTVPPTTDTPTTTDTQSISENKEKILPEVESSTTSKEINHITPTVPQLLRQSSDPNELVNVVDNYKDILFSIAEMPFKEDDRGAIRYGWKD